MLLFNKNFSLRIVKCFKLLYNCLMKKFVFGLMIFFAGVFCFANAELTEFESKIMAEITDFRWKLALFDDFEKAAQACDEFSSYVNNPETAENLSEEILLSANNILTWEKYNALYELNPKNKELEAFLTAQYRKIRSYFKEHKKEVHNKWLYVTAGDILSSSLQYLPLSTAMNEGLTIKKYYDKALDNDPEFVFCLINIAQWYFHAPAISGGGKGKAMKAFLAAEKAAKTDAELYYAKLFLSQSFYENGDKQKAAELLDQAENLLPGSRTVKFYRFLNEHGYYYFEYPENREKINKKLGI